MKSAVIVVAVAAVLSVSCATSSSNTTSVAAAKAGAPKMNPYGKRFVGDGITVEMATVADQNADGLYDALLKISGAEAYNAGIDGKVIHYHARPGGTGVDFVTTVNGQEYVRMISRQSWGEWTFFEVYLDGKTAKVMFDDKGSKDVKPDELAAAYVGAN